MDVIGWFKKNKFDFVVGVPCSEIKNFLSNINYVPATREDEAIGIAVGADFAGKKPLVFMQNTGLTLSCNAILSLLKPFGINIKILITQHCNAEHHKYTTEALPKFLKIMDYKNYVLAKNEQILK